MFIDDKMRAAGAAELRVKFPKSAVCENAHHFADVVCNAVEQYVAHNPAPYEPKAIPMILTCPACSARHIDEGEHAKKLHHTHACQQCGMVWRPAIVDTVGVQFLPGFKNT